MGRYNKIRTWVLFGHSKFNLNYFTAVWRYYVGHLALVFLTVVLLMECCYMGLISSVAILA